ncbi:HAD-like protein [Lindgomyces ingoldianus]|uniref:HAD-like protein n=1 Tax=Lindgomyces ingoldianus TaxID=673940 RepID=A0ACB6Q9T9_9PLEO|nr:HAD-like protein [Lindgomyces ingoldianus]KAF2463137.1 HAD-like protein [Lindgomyces ingoldianus]
MAVQTPPRVRACLFDMDGLLIDSEDLYTTCTNIVLHENNRPSLPWSIKAQLQGRPGPQASEIFYAWAQLPITPDEFYARLAQLQKEHFPKTQPLPGVLELLKGLRERRVRTALATSSHRRNFELKTTHLPYLFEHFEEDHTVLGDDERIPTGRGKPAPDIYLLALRTINEALSASGEEEIKPEECLVFEDSVPGVESGRRAGMQVVWCPHPELLEEYKGREKEVLAGLTGAHKEEEEEELGKSEVEVLPGKRRVGQPGVIDDGWAKLLQTLEGFPYHIYGMEEVNGKDVPK